MLSSGAGLKYISDPDGRAGCRNTSPLYLNVCGSLLFYSAPFSVFAISDMCFMITPCLSLGPYLHTFGGMCVVVKTRCGCGGVTPFAVYRGFLQQ